MKEAQGGKELVGVVYSGVVETKSEEERIVQAFKVSSQLWVGRPRHEWNSTNAEWPTRDEPAECLPWTRRTGVRRYLPCLEM